jgi:hypothetical protein
MADFAGVTVPPELEVVGVRRLVLSGAGKVLAVLGVLMLVGAPIVGPLIWRSAVEGERRMAVWRDQAVPSRGTVVDVSRTGKNGSRLRVRYSYLQEGVRYQGQGEIPSNCNPAPGVGSEVPILVVFSLPSESWMAGYEPVPTPRWMAVFLPLIMLFITAAAAFKVRRQMRLLENARGAVARVIEVQRVNRGQHGRFWRVRYEYKSLEGALLRGKYQVGRNAPPVGAGIVIVYDRDDVERSAPYPLKLVRIASGGF